MSWYSHMLVLERAYELTTGIQVNYTNPDASRNFHQWLVVFFNDNTILHKLENLGYDSNGDKILEAAKKYLEVWQRLVYITGEELELNKSSYAMITWKLQKGTELMYNIDDAPGIL